MYSSNCNNNANCGCNHRGERILVNQGCGCNNRRRSCCQNTFRPGCGTNRCMEEEVGCGCNHHNNGCGCGQNHENCGCNTCPPRPCPPKPCPRPTCEDRCRAQYRHCMRNCRCKEEHERPCNCDMDYDTAE